MTVDIQKGSDHKTPGFLARNLRPTKGFVSVEMTNEPRPETERVAVTELVAGDLIDLEGDPLIDPDHGVDGHVCPFEFMMTKVGDDYDNVGEYEMAGEPAGPGLYQLYIQGPPGVLVLPDTHQLNRKCVPPLWEPEEGSHTMAQAGKFTHVFERCNADADSGWERVGTADLDAMLYSTSRSHWEVAEEMLATFHRDNQLPEGTYRVLVATFQGHLIILVERPLPLPPEWAALPTWPDHTTGEVARAHAGMLLAAYPGAGVELIGRHVRVFADHYGGRISTPQLAEQTGYHLPPEVPRPYGRNVEVPPENA